MIETLNAMVTLRRQRMRAVLITSPALRATLLGANGRSDPFGVPIVATEAALSHVIGVDPAGVLLADGGATIEASKEATVELADAPVGGASAVLTSAWQSNLLAFKSEYILNWVATADSVQYAVQS